MELPNGSRVWIALNADAAWTTADYLAAEQADALQWGNWQRAGNKGKKPAPILRPADMRKRAESVAENDAQALAFMERRRRRAAAAATETSP